MKLISLVDTSEAVIDPAASVVTVTVLESDDPAGLIVFDPDSRYAVVLFVIDVPLCVFFYLWAVWSMLSNQITHSQFL